MEISGGAVVLLVERGAEGPRWGRGSSKRATFDWLARSPSLFSIIPTMIPYLRGVAIGAKPENNGGWAVQADRSQPRSFPIG